MNIKNINSLILYRKKHLHQQYSSPPPQKKTPLQGSTLGASSASPSPSNPPPPSVSDTAAVRPDPHQARPGRRKNMEKHTRFRLQKLKGFFRKQVIYLEGVRQSTCTNIIKCLFYGLTDGTFLDIVPFCKSTTTIKEPNRFLDFCPWKFTVKSCLCWDHLENAYLVIGFPTSEKLCMSNPFPSKSLLSYRKE